MSVTIDQVKYYSPIYYFHPYERAFPCSIEHLLLNSILRAADGSVLATNPSQDNLTANSSDGGKGRYVDVNASQFPGQPLQGGAVASPIYYAVQTYVDAIVIHYLSLYAYQAGQTCRALRVLSEFDCIINTFGIHQGDLERVGVVLSNDGQFRLLAVDYEAHGDHHIYAPALVPHVADASGWHPQVGVALNGHSHHNLQRQPNPYIDDETPGVVAITSEMSTAGATWTPTAVGDFRLLGLDADKAPIGDQHWAKFAGRLGKHQNNKLDSATYLDGSNLSGLDWAFVKLIDFGADLLDKYPDSIKIGDGPEGPGARDWVTQPVPGTSYFGSGLSEISGWGDLGQGPGAVAFLGGRFFDADQASILQFWDNGNVAAIAYAVGDDGTFRCFSTTNDLGQGPGAVAWLKGRFLGDRTEQVIQLWANGGSLGLILYGTGDQGNVHCLWSSGDMGQGPGAVAWLTGDFAGSGRDELLQCWGNGGSLGMIRYRADDSGAMSCTWGSGNMGEGPGAVAWLTGDFAGTGKTQVLQCWGNGGSLGLIRYGDDGNGGMKVLWGSGDLGEGPGAVAWLAGDFLGLGHDQLLQCWGNGGSLGMILYGDDGAGDGGLAKLWRSNDMGQGPGAVAWLVGDYDGKGKSQVLQCWGNGGSLGMILYGDNGAGGLTCLWSSDDMGEGPGAVAWFAGNFTGAGRDRVIQLWNHGNLAAIEYGALAGG